MENNKKTDFGSMIGIIIVLIVLIIGAFYFVRQRIEKSKEFQASIQLGVATASSSFSTSSDAISDIEKDTNSIDVNSLGSGINSL